MGMSNAVKKRYLPYGKGELSFPEIMSKGLASYYLVRKVDLGLIDELVEATDSIGRKLYPIVPLFRKSKRNPVFRRKSLKKTLKLWERHQLEKNGTVVTV